ncbi:MAG: hypothetical protein Q7W30_00230 [Coriobacteriia bacterium]|nr:hypothetical protein [Coriobacteriia bacterium]
MDEISVWFEVVRGILPPRYAVRLAWDQRALIVTSPGEERIAWIDERELATLSPTRAIRLIEAKLRQPDSRLHVAIAV